MRKTSKSSDAGKLALIFQVLLQMMKLYVVVNWSLKMSVHMDGAFVSCENSRTDNKLYKLRELKVTSVLLWVL